MEREHIREFPWQKVIHPDYLAVIPQAADGSPYGELYVESCAFDTFLYRTEPLTVVKEFQEITSIYDVEDEAKKPRAFRLAGKIGCSGLPKTILKSQDMTISVLRAELTEPMLNYGMRNGDGNEIYFVHDGRGIIYTDFGYLGYEKGDYIFLPKGTTYAVFPFAASLFVIAEIPKPVFMPRHSWLSDFFPYDPSAITPAFPDPMKSIGNEVAFEIFLKTDGNYRTKIIHPFSPFNCVGWQGKLYPFKLSLEHIHTLISPTFHLPPIALITFTTEDMNAMISTFKPRWVHSLPYNHMNDHEEFLFYHLGEYGARTGIQLGDATLHPVGVHHGPQPRRMKAWKRTESRNLPWREETAIMFESRAPFSTMNAGKDLEIEGYDSSWKNEWEEIEGAVS